MYTEFFGLKTLPFENVPDPKFFFDQGDYDNVRKRISDSLKAERGLIVVTGPMGSGKTILSQMIKADFSRDTKLIWMVEPPGDSNDLFLFIAQALGLKLRTSKISLILDAIGDALIKINSEGSNCLLIIDESHLISDDTLNGILLLNSLGEGAAKFIQILLLGRGELLKTINRPEMVPFKKCIATMVSLGKMDTENIRKYISHRIQVAGGRLSIFSDTAWKALELAFGTGCTPLIINLLCDRSLSEAFESNKKIIDVDDVYEAARGVGLQDNIFYYRVVLKQLEEAELIMSGSDNGTSLEPEKIVKETEKSFNNGSNNNGSDRTDLEHSDVQPEMTQPAHNIGGNGFSSDPYQKNLKSQCRTLLHRILGKITGQPAETEETIISPEAGEGQTVKETAAVHIENETQTKAEAKVEETVPTDEWVTIDSKGAKSFKPDDVKDKEPAEKKETTANHDEWILMDAKRQGEFKIINARSKKPGKARETAPSSEWVTMGSKGVKLFKPADINDKKPAAKKNNGAKPDEWVRIGAKKD